VAFDANHLDGLHLGARRPTWVTTALRFAVVGIGGVAVNILALHVLYGLAHVPLVPATAMSAELAIVHNYLLNDRWTFGRRRPSLSRFARFNLGTLLTILVNVVVVWLMVRAGIDYLAANLAAIGIAAALNFGTSSAWVWREGAA
jgi:putative flippase GtrA